LDGGDKGGIAPAGLALGDVKRRLVLLLMLFTGICATAVYTALSPILPKLAEHFGGSGGGELTAQLGMAMPSIGIMLGGVLSGWVVARIGLRPLLLAAIVGYGVFGAAGGYFGDIWSFSATRLLLGFCGAFLTTASVTLLAELYDEAGRSKMIGYWKASMGFAVVLVAPASGWTAAAFGWQAAFLLFAALAAPMALLAFFVVPKLHVAAVSDAARSGGGVWGLWPIFLMIFLLHVMMMMGNNQIPFLLTAKGLASPRDIATVMMLTAPVGGLASIFSGHLQTRFGERQVLCCAIAAAGLGSIATGLAPSVLAAALGSALMTLGTGTFLPLYMTMPLGRVAPARRSTAIGFVQVSMYLGAFMNPFLLHPLREAFGLEGMYVAIGVMAVTGAALGGLRVALSSRARPVPVAGG
jgi:MFS family permease